MGFWTGFTQQLGASLGELNRQKEQQKMKSAERQIQLLNELAKSEDPNIASMAVTGLMDLHTGKLKPAGNALGKFFGSDWEQHPAFGTISKMAELKRKEREEVDNFGREDVSVSKPQMTPDNPFNVSSSLISDPSIAPPNPLAQHINTTENKSQINPNNLAVVGTPISGQKPVDPSRYLDDFGRSTPAHQRALAEQANQREHKQKLEIEGVRTNRLLGGIEARGENQMELQTKRDQAAATRQADRLAAQERIAGANRGQRWNLALMKRGSGSKEVDDRAVETAYGLFQREGKAGLAGLDKDIKNAVLIRAADDNFLPVPKELKKTLDSYGPAYAGIQTLKNRIDDFESKKVWDDLWGTYKALDDLVATSSAITRVVGRTLGEKGVFTDRDAETFKGIMAKGAAITAGDINWIRTKVSQTEQFIDLTRDYVIQQYDQYSQGSTAKPNFGAATGGPLTPPPGPAAKPSGGKHFRFNTTTQKMEEVK